MPSNPRAFLIFLDVHGLFSTMQKYFGKFDKLEQYFWHLVTFFIEQNNKDGWIP
jgi:hypothetical protein